VDPRLSADTLPDFLKPSTADGEAPVIFPRTDDPEHHRVRRMMTRDFTFRRAEAMRPQIQGLVDGLLDDMVRSGPPADLVRLYALPVPSLAICLLLGVPYADHEFFQRHSTTGLDRSASEEERAASGMAMFEYMTDLVGRKEREPGDDLMSRLVADHVVPGHLSRATAAVTAMILLQAGHETTSSMIALGALALLQRPDHLARVREADDPAVIARAVEELMRYLSIVHSLVDRVAIENLTIGGESVSAGDTVLMNLPAGNWDPAFVDRPDTLDIDRKTQGHLGFGYGVHQCIGQNLARVELQIAIGTLVRRLPSLELAVPAHTLTFNNDQEIYGIEEMPVRW
jgi:cytochrome P450